MHYQTSRDIRRKAAIGQGERGVPPVDHALPYTVPQGGPVPERNPRPAPPPPVQRPPCPITAAIALIGPRWGTHLSADDRNLVRRRMALALQSHGVPETPYGMANFATYGLEGIGITARIADDGASLVIPDAAWDARNTTRNGA